MTKYIAILNQFESALIRLEEVMEKPKDDIVRDSAIKRFEIVFDLSWKIIKSFLEEKHNIVCHSPASCFREAYQQKLIEYDDIWLKIAKHRNELAHTYRQETADRVYGELPEIISHFKNLLEAVKK